MSPKLIIPSNSYYFKSLIEMALISSANYPRNVNGIMKRAHCPNGLHRFGHRLAADSWISWWLIERQAAVANFSTYDCCERNILPKHIWTVGSNTPRALWLLSQLIGELTSNPNAFLIYFVELKSSKYATYQSRIVYINFNYKSS